MPSDLYRRVLSLALGGLLFQSGARGLFPVDAPVDVEAVFRAVQLLAERSTLEVAPFVSSWIVAVNDLDRGAPRIGTLHRFFENLVRSASGEPFRVSMAEAELRSFIEAHLPGSGRGTVFAQTAQHMITALRRIVWITDPNTVEYLSPILRLLDAQRRLVIVTLNCDNTIELMAAHHGIDCITGIDEWSRGATFYLDGDGLYLLKLHGSINWELVSNQTSEGRPMPHSVIRRRSFEEMSSSMEDLEKAHTEAWRRQDYEELSRISALLQRFEYPPTVIFGGRNKLTAEGPYLDLLRAFREELSQISLLTVIGYSFRGPHVNEYVTRWLNVDPGNRMRVINGKEFWNRPTEYAQLLKERVPDRVEEIRCHAGEALKGLWT